MKAKPVLKRILPAVAQSFGLAENDIMSHSRKAELVDARSMTVALLLSHPQLRQQDAARLLDISQAAVSHLLARHQWLMLTDKAYRERYEAINR